MNDFPVPLHNLMTPAPDLASLYVNREWSINWPQVIKRRPILLEHSQNMPPYLVLPEIEWLLDAAFNDNTNLLIDTLWHTGARVSELLALTPQHFIIDGEANDALVSLHTLKRRKRGRPTKLKSGERSVKRLVPVTDEMYLLKVKRYIASHHIGAKARLFPITRQTVNNRIKALAKTVDGLPFAPTAHTFRHSFAVNTILHGAHVKALQGWLGHRHAETTEIYTQVLGTETSHFMRPVRYSQHPAVATIVHDSAAQVGYEEQE